jgi:hypothetical protein
MVDSPHPPLTDVMMERPCELIHMDLVPSSCEICGWDVVCPSSSGRLLSICLGLLFGGKGETFGFVRDLVLRLKEWHGDAI